MNITYCEVSTTSEKQFSQSAKHTLHLIKNKINSKKSEELFIGESF